LRDVGENRVQEALGKIPLVTVPLRWHLIGHLQRNKVRQLDRFRWCIRWTASASRTRSRHTARLAVRPLEVLAQINVSGEESKGGYEPGTFEREAERLRGSSGLVVRA
jgi:uncharacterized pyridoxal phosphate-containing UPF0001 family protein